MKLPHNPRAYTRRHGKPRVISLLIGLPILLFIIACCSMEGFAVSGRDDKTQDYAPEPGTADFSSADVESGEPSLGPVKVSYSLGENKSALRVVGLFDNPSGYVLDASLVSEVVYGGSRTVIRGPSTSISPFSRVVLMDYFVPEDDKGYTLISYAEFARQGENVSSRTGVQMVSGRVYAGLSYRSLAMLLLGISILSFTLFWLQKSRMRRLRAAASGSDAGIVQEDLQAGLAGQFRRSG